MDNLKDTKSLYIGRIRDDGKGNPEFYMYDCEDFENSECIIRFCRNGIFCSRDGGKNWCTVVRLNGTDNMDKGGVE